jgi:hypothetical protein
VEVAGIAAAEGNVLEVVALVVRGLDDGVELLNFCFDLGVIL